jgi:hypothetical protein
MLWSVDNPGRGKAVLDFCCGQQSYDAPAADYNGMMVEYAATRLNRDNPASLDNEIRLFHRLVALPLSLGLRQPFPYAPG